MPHFSDKSDAVWRRLLLIPFRARITDTEKRPEYLRAEHWAAELPGVLNWELDGLTRYRANRKVTASTVVAEAVEQHRTESDTARAFVAEYVRAADPKVARQVATVTAEIHKRYVEWASENGYKHTVTSTRLGRAIGRKFPGATSEPCTISGVSRRCWVGIEVSGVLAHKIDAR